MTLSKTAEHQKISQLFSVNTRLLYEKASQPGPLMPHKMRNNEGKREGKQNKANQNLFIL